MYRLPSFTIVPDSDRIAAEAGRFVSFDFGVADFGSGKGIGCGFSACDQRINRGPKASEGGDIVCTDCAFTVEQAAVTNPNVQPRMILRPIVFGD